MPDLNPAGAVWTVEVGFTSHRPVRPDEHTVWVMVEAATEAEAIELALVTVASVGFPHVFMPACVMPTSANILSCEV